MSSGLVCKQCGCSEIDTDPTQGNAVCTQCGSVLEDQLIISEVQFAENAMGGASVVGQFVSADGPKSMGLGGAFHHGMGKESRQVTLENGKHRIQRLGAQLKLNQHCIDTAFNFFKMAVGRRLTRGRRTNHVIAACVYIVCRTEGTPHMLLDFSDVLQIDVYTLGRTYLQLSKELCITIPALDPCLYIHRFAHKLEFAEKTHEVSMTALRLLQRMKRDWMAQGRRPSGLCGAALLVAARVHDFSRKIKDIIRVVKIGEGTIRKRLAEFEATPSSQLTIDEFQKIDLEEEMDPPCFTESKKKAKLQQLESGHLNTLTTEITELQKQIDKAIEEANHKKFSRYKKYMSSEPTGDTSSEASMSRMSSPIHLGTDESPDQSTAVNSFIIEETLKNIVTDSDLSKITSNTVSKVVGVPEIVDVDREGLLDTDSRSSLEESTNHEQRQRNGEVSQESHDDTKCSTGLIPRPSAESLGITNTIEEYMKDTTADKVCAEEKNVDCELDLSGIDDEEIEMFLLSEKEVRIKTSLWMKANADYLKELKEKQEREAREREEAEKNPDLKKKKKPRRKQTKVEHSTAADAIKMMLQEKKISSKINYEVLKDLNKPAGGDTSNSAPQDAGPVLGAGPIEVTPVNLKSRFKRPSDTVKSEPGTKKLKTEEGIKLEAKQEVVVETGPVIIESGPIQYDEVHEDVEEDFDEEEEDEHISAAALMGHHGANEEDYHDYGYEDD